MNGERTQGGLSAKTLMIAAAASAVAAFLVPLLWRPGTVIAAAMTPIVVSIVSEALKRPAERVSAVRTRRTTGSFAAAENPLDPLAPPPAEDLAALPTRTAPRATHRRRLLTPRQWKLGLATGLAAFFVAASVVTASDFLAGDAVTAGGSRTTLFGGSADDTATDKPATGRHKRAKQEEQAAPQATATPQATGAPTQTATPVPTASPTTTPTAPKAAAPTPEPTVAP